MLRHVGGRYHALRWFSLRPTPRLMRSARLSTCPHGPGMEGGQSNPARDSRFRSGHDARVGRTDMRRRATKSSIQPHRMHCDAFSPLDSCAMGGLSDHPDPPSPPTRPSSILIGRCLKSPSHRTSTPNAPINPIQKHPQSDVSSSTRTHIALNEAPCPLPE